jgi:hypothetical protein
MKVPINFEDAVKAFFYRTSATEDAAIRMRLS